METANPILSELATALIAALVPVLIGALAWLVRYLIAWVKARTTREQYEMLSQLARQAVTAVEQTLKTKPAAEKLQAAKVIVTGALLEKGIRLDEGTIVAAIESAVYAEKWSINVTLPESATASAAIEALPSETPTESATF